MEVKLLCVLCVLCLSTYRACCQRYDKEWTIKFPFYGDEGDNETSPLQIYQKVAIDTYEYPGYDGWYNNRAHPDWGGADMPMLRRLPSAYADGVYAPSGQNRPNPFNISRAVLKGPTGRSSERNRTAFLVFFGQQVVEEILDAQRPGCPPEFFNISVPVDHELNPENRTGWFMPLQRSRYDMRNTGFSPNSPREQLNEITPFIDGGLMYGVGKTWADSLRSLTGGKLASTLDDEELPDDSPFKGKDFPAINKIRLPMANPPPPRDHFLKNVDRFFRLGNPRGNENPFLLTFGIFWYRWHNRLADRIGKELWDAYNTREVQDAYDLPKYGEKDFYKHFDERIFNEARKWTIATHQKIVVYDWLPSWLGTFENGTSFNLPEYSGYKPYVHPQIMHVFQSAAMRFGHTLVPPGVYRRELFSENNDICKIIKNTNVTGEASKGRSALRTCNVYWNGQESVGEYNIDQLILGMSAQITEREDNIITPDLRGNVFGGLDFSRRDLMAVNIQRGRDHGLPDYNTARREFNLPEIRNWTDINKVRCGNETLLETSDDCMHIRGLREVYGSLDDIDIWPGGISETTADGPGDLFRSVIADQFTRIRDGDRFWFENENNKLFTKEQIERIKTISVRDIILQITDITNEELAGNPFFYATTMDKCNRLVARLDTRFPNASFAAFVTCSSNSTCPDVKRDILAVMPSLSDSELKAFGLDCSNVNSLADDPCRFETIDDTNRTLVEPCTPLKGFDYFSGSEVSFILTFVAIGLFAIGNVMLLVYCARRRQASIENLRKAGRAQSKRNSKDQTLHEVAEWQGHKEGDRDIKVRLDLRKKALLIFTGGNIKVPSRTIDCKNADKMYVKESVDKGNFVLIRVPKEYDLVLKFDSVLDKNDFVEAIGRFCGEVDIAQKRVMLSEKELKAEAVTKAKRQATLDKFFRIVFKHAFRIDEGSGYTSESLSEEETKAVVHCELSIVEFADALALKPTSLFVKNMFELIDKDRNGFISFREFLDMIVIFSKGGPEDKAKLLFDMYDVNGNGTLTKDDFRTMLRSLMELANTTVEDAQIDTVTQSMFQEAGLAEREVITLDDFNRLLRDYKDQLSYAQLQWTGTGQKLPDAAPQEAIDRHKTVVNRENAPSRARKTILRAYGDKVARMGTKRHTAIEVKVKPRKARTQETASRWTQVRNYIENYRLHIFWVSLYSLVCVAIFLERSYYFAIEREHAALRRIVGYGVPVTRGAASGQMFTYSCLLLTMCRNLITKLRETFLNRFIPFDSAVWFHKYIAGWAMFFTIVHVIGHSMNFYQISTQTPGDLSCLFRNYFRSTHILPKFHYWCWNTITGFTGVLLTLLVIVIYTYAMQYSRRTLFRWFWLSHQMYFVLYILMVLHGSGMLVQPPIFYTFFIGPVVVFTLDVLVSLSRNKAEVSVVKAEILPSEVLGLTFKKPSSFEYRSGQWVRIACLELGGQEYHPFTISSAPHEEHLSLHIRAIGPWTMNLRTAYDPAVNKDKPYPKLYLDGPFGEGHQDWYQYEVAVLVGGGIGVTPFASILKDIVQKSALGTKFKCKKVYFLWITRNQKQFEWLVDIIRDVEEKDSKDFVSTHIFITQFYQKFDLRTTMLYICERHFQKVSNKSLFTGLRAITHFGRPDLPTFLNSLQDEHPGASQIGVFSCGPPQMTYGVEEACSNLNKHRTAETAAFIHHFENF